MSTLASVSTNVQPEIAIEDLEHDYPKWVRKFVDQLDHSRRQKVLEFAQELELSGAKAKTIIRYIRAIRTLGVNGKPYENLVRKDLIQWMGKLPNMQKNGTSRLSDETVNLTKRLCKRFLRFCHNGELDGKTPKILKCIRIRKSKNRLPERILSKEEVRKLVDVCERQRNRAMIFVLYESGCRASELLSLKNGDVQIDDHGAVIKVKGKTGQGEYGLLKAFPISSYGLICTPTKMIEMHLSESHVKVDVNQLIGTTYVI